MVIATLRGSLPEQAVARDEAKVVLATLQDEQRTRIRKRCGAAAAWHLREGRSLQALRWLRIAESKHAADREMLDSIARLSAELKPLCKDLRDAGRNVLQRTGGHREMRRIGESLSVVDGADSIVFRLMFNTLRSAYEPALPALAIMMAAEVGRSEAYRTLARAIGAGDPEAAQAAARQLLEPATQALIAALSAMEEKR